MVFLHLPLQLCYYKNATENKFNNLVSGVNMSEQSNTFIQLNEDDSAYVTTATGTTYVSNEMNALLESVMHEVVNFAKYIQSQDPEITENEAYHVLVAVLSTLPTKFNSDSQASAQLLNLIQEFKKTKQEE